MHYIIAIAGWVLYNFFIFSKTKDASDDKGVYFNYKKYINKQWDNWAFTLLLAPVLVYYMDDIRMLVGLWLGRDVPHYEIYYLGCGVLTELIYYGFSKMASLRSKD